MDKNKNILESLTIDNLGQVLQKAAYSQPREGMKIEVDHSKLGDKFVHIDAYCLSKPEYIYRLSFQDFITGSVINLDEYSVCKISLEDNPANEKSHLAVCGELIEKRNRTIATNITIMPSIPLLPHLLSLIFTRQISLFEFKQRYGGCKIGASELKFNNVFTGKDIEEINEIRKEISIALFDEKGILNPAPLTVKDKIVKLISKKRLPYLEEKYRGLITHNENIAENTETEADNEENEYYLKPLKKIKTVKEDLRN